MATNTILMQNAMSLLHAGREEEARRLLAGHLKKNPMDAGANKLMAMIAGGLGQLDVAAQHLRRAVTADSKDWEARYMLGNVLVEQRKYAEAAEAYRAHWTLRPTDPAASRGWAQCLISLGKLDEALVVLRRAIEAAPLDANPVGNMASLLATVGRVGEAMEVAREGYARLPHATGLLYFLVQNGNFVEDVDPVEHRRQHERIGAEWAAATDRPEPVFGQSRDPDRPIRVGFMSADFGPHACAMFMRAPLLHMDRSRVIPYCYSCMNWEGDAAEPFRRACVWRDVSALDDRGTAAAVMADQIDILVDCSGHFAGNRLRAMIPRAAPIQCTWLGYPNTTGVPTMDYRIVDAVTDPPGTESHASERLARLGACFLCFTPAPDSPEPRPTPAMADPGAPITFGSFNRLDKTMARTLDVWCRVLRAVPGSRMMLKSRMMTPELKAGAIALFTARGIEAERIVPSDYVADPAKHLAMYHGMDIALDTFPYNGTTTTCEALWMGVPVVTLAGKVHRGRVGASLLSAVGLPELIARDTDEYVKIAAQLANDRPRLGALKGSLRAQMAASPLCDAAGYAARFEELLREMWKNC